jgi:hypothetical protein
VASISGDISLMPIGDVILWLANRKLFATLQVQRQSYRANFIIREGKLVQAASSDPREFLGQHLINFGYIDEESLQKAFDTQKETKVPLGKILIMVGGLTEEQLDRVLLFKARESLLEVMTFTDGTFRVGDQVPDNANLDAIVPIDLLEVHSEGQARENMWADMRRYFPSDAVQFDVMADPAEARSAFDKRLLAALASGASIGELALEMRSTSFHIYARLYDLSERGQIKPRVQTAAGLELPPDEIIISEEDVESVEIDVIASPRVDPKGVERPEEAVDPAGAMRLAMNTRDYDRALLVAERILERDPDNAEAIAVKRVSEINVKKLEDSGIREEMFDPGAVPHLKVPRAQVAQAHLTSKERYVLARIDGRRTLQQIAAVSPVKPNELFRIVQAFVEQDVVRLEG